MNYFQNKVALVTGAGRGIGRAVALALSERGARVAFLSRNSKELESAANNLKGEVLVLPCDVSNESSVMTAFEKIDQNWGRIDILVNNAGFISLEEIQFLTAENLDQTFGVNVRGAFLCAREAMTRMKAQYTSDATQTFSIVNVSSLGGIRGNEKFKGMSAYVASKHAVVGLTEALAVEGREFGARVNCVAPGAVDTQMLWTAVPYFKTNTKPEDLVGTFLYLCDPAMSAKVTGAVIEVHSNA